MDTEVDSIFWLLRIVLWWTWVQIEESALLTIAHLYLSSYCGQHQLCTSPGMQHYLYPLLLPILILFIRFYQWGPWIFPWGQWRCRMNSSLLSSSQSLNLSVPDPRAYVLQQPYEILRRPSTTLNLRNINSAPTLHKIHETQPSLLLACSQLLVIFERGRSSRETGREAVTAYELSLWRLEKRHFFLKTCYFYLLGCCHITPFC